LYLSRIKLDVTNRNTLRALNAPSRFHGAIESAFPGERKRRLWRLDNVNGALYLLLLSEDQPHFQSIAVQFCSSENDCEIKCYDSLLKRIENGTVWRFRLVANPTYSKKKDDARGVVHAHITTDYQAQWLTKKSERCGFRLAEFQVTESKWQQFYKAGGKRPVTLITAAYEGILEVTDAAKFREALREGIGRGKAYGMGLLTVMRTKEA